MPGEPGPVLWPSDRLFLYDAGGHMIRRETFILMLLLLATPGAAGRKVVIPGVALTIEEPWKACWIAPGELSDV